MSAPDSSTTKQNRPGILAPANRGITCQRHANIGILFRTEEGLTAETRVGESGLALGKFLKAQPVQFTGTCGQITPVGAGQNRIG